MRHAPYTNLDRAAMLGTAALLLAGVTVSGCNSVLGLSDFNANGCPAAGQRECVGNVPRVCGNNGVWKDEPACEDGCQNGQCLCSPPGLQRCIGKVSQLCGSNGEWTDDKDNTKCIQVCTPGVKQCATDNRPQTCDINGQWKDADEECRDQTCMDGGCAGVCAPEQKSCLGNTPQTCDAGQWKDVATGSCSGKTCIDGVCAGQCENGDTRCADNTPEICDENGQWQNLMAPCVNKACDDVTSTCVGVCEPNQKRCSNEQVQKCDTTGTWVDDIMCSAPMHCEAGQCILECQTGDVRCTGNTPEECIAGIWQASLPCSAQTCVNGVCTGECAPLDAICAGQTPQTCDANGQWKNQPACSGTCIEGSCPGPSCSGLPDTCGPAGNESCCLSPLVPGGSYYRSNDPGFEATVSGFRLDRFEVTVGRFRKFVEAYPGSQPAMNAGQHPLIPGSGWDTAWDGLLPAEQAELRTALKCAPLATWTDEATIDENRPINCLDWYTAFAFCAWDGGRLPTEAEWNYAAAAGSEQRQFPWSSPPGSQMIDESYAAYLCLGGGNGGSCFLEDILHVGSKSTKGDGKYRQADLGGNMQEWSLDVYQQLYPSPCVDCAQLQAGANRVIRGGGWNDGAPLLFSFSRSGTDPKQRGPYLGARCARSP